MLFGPLEHIQSDVTELNWYGLDFDELTNGLAIMHYSRHRLTALVAYVTMLTYVSNNDQVGSAFGHFTKS